ncbi:endonuclease/exonuclease/phosphatase family protein [Tabrizicola sp. BL-A-41-H6]|uniref:endonuclease/exonuclease/phosphatase family protein n=1 Tax=Tabrizicola sp. BL-A-41-H6 TaxID=3421107 RepID=UPI003D67879B
MKVLQFGLSAGVAVVLLCLAAGYLGRLHPAGDSFAVFRPQGALALVLLAGGAVMLAMPGVAAVALGVALITGAPILLSRGAAEAMGGVALYQKNMLDRNDDLAGLEADIRAAAPDILTLQEVSDPNLPLLERLADVLPHRMFCTFEDVGGVAVATRFPPVAGSEICAHGLAAMQVEGPNGRVWLVSVHLNWPWPYGQAAHLKRLLPVIEGLDGPVVIAGDFNMVRWSAALARVRAASRTTAVGPVLGSYVGFGPWMLLPIDQVMAPGGGTAEVRPRLGSDHLGVLARVGI